MNSCGVGEGLALNVGGMLLFDGPAAPSLLVQVELVSSMIFSWVGLIVVSSQDAKEG